MRESIGGAGLFQIVIVLLLLFTAYFCLSINYTSAYKVTDAINNQIKKDEGISPQNIREVLKEAHYTASGQCNNPGSDNPDEKNWHGFTLNSTNEIMDAYGTANYCLKKIKVADVPNLPPIYYYRIKVFYNIDVPLINNINFNVKADSSNVYTPNENGEYITLPVATA